MGTQRFVSIDIMRGLAIAGMVLCHFTIDWSEESKNPLIFFIGNHILGDWPAAFFVFLVGVSQAISIARHEQKGVDKALIKRRGIKRGFLIIIVGLLLNICTLGPGSIFSWDILALIGASLILIQYLKDWKPEWIITACMGVIVLSPFLRESFGYLVYWGGSMVPVTVITSFIPNILYDPISDYISGFGTPVITGFFINGYFPVFPWIIFSLLGYVIGNSLFTNRFKINPVWRFPQSIGILCILIGFIIGYAGSLRQESDLVNEIITPFSFYPITTSMILLLFGLALCVLELLRRVFDGLKTQPSWIKIPEQLSRYSLSLYLIHLLIIYVPILIFTSFYPMETFVLTTISPPLGLFLGIVFLICFTLLTIRWDRIKGKYSFEWMMANVIED